MVQSKANTYNNSYDDEACDVGVIEKKRVVHGGIVRYLEEADSRGVRMKTQALEGSIVRTALVRFLAPKTLDRLQCLIVYVGGYGFDRPAHRRCLSSICKV